MVITEVVNISPALIIQFEIKKSFENRLFAIILFYRTRVRSLATLVTKGSCHLRFSGIRPLRGYPPPPTPLTEKQSEKKEGFFP